MYDITNKTREVRKFLDTRTGKLVYVKPKQTVQTHRQLKESDIWKVEEQEKKKKKKQEVDEI